MPTRGGTRTRTTSRFGRGWVRVVALSLPSLLTACAGSAGTTAAQSTGPAAPRATAPISGPTSGPTAADTSSTPPGSLRQGLLSAAELPVPGGQGRWRITDTGNGDGQRPASVCQRTPLASIGATQIVRRDFRLPGMSAVHLVARFPDELTATQAYSVLEAWLRECAGRLEEQGYQGKPPGGFTATTGGSTAGFAVLFYGPVPGQPDSSYLEPQALVRTGDTLSWVVWHQIGQDYNYEPGSAPPEQAISAMSRKLPAD